MKRVWTIICVAALLLGSCKSPIQIPDDDSPEIIENPDDKDDSDDDSQGTGRDDDVNTGGSKEEEIDESEYTDHIDIVWNGSSVSIENKTGLGVSNDGGHVVVGSPTSAGKEIRINMSGKSSDGSLKVYNGVKASDTNKKLLLSFNGVELTSSKGPAVNIQSSKTVSVLLAAGSSNYLCDAASYSGVPASEDAKGTFFSENQLVFSGEGTLSIDGKSKHAIAVDDYITFQGGKLIIKSAVTDGIHAGDYVRIDGGSLDITSSGEGIQCEDAEKGYFYMVDGQVKIQTGGQKSGGIETALDVIIEGGKLEITTTGAASKCIKSDNNVTISGGTLNLQTSGAGMYDSAARDAVACACIKAENNVVLKGGNITCKSTGTGGKGVNCYKFECNEPTVLDVTTNGSKYSYSSSQSCRPKAIKASNGVVVNGGDITVLTTGTEAEGIESKTTIDINGGRIAVQAKDDGINAAGVITFKGGYTYVYSTGNDGIDTNNNKANSIVVDGGVVMSHSAQSPEEGFDADNHAYLTFKSGYVFCTGGQQGGGGGGGGRPGGGWPGGGGGTTGSNPSCSQPSYLWNKSVSVGYFNLADASGKIVMSCYIPRALSTNYSFVSAPLTTGSSYKYGVTSTAPTGATTVFGKYFFSDGTPSSTLSTSFTAGSGYVGSL